MAKTDIVIRGAREHNLQGVDLRIPRNKLIAMTGVSGSGKSSLAFDTLYAEGQRRYVESLSSYARQFMGQLPKPDVDAISGLAPCISIEQKTAGRNPRSTVGTMTEIYDYLRVLFARVGKGYCYVSGKPIQAQTVDQIVESILKLPEGTKFQILAPVVWQQKGEFRDFFDDLVKRGFLRARVDGNVEQLTNPPTLKKNYKHDIDIVIDRLVGGKANRNRIAEAVENAVKLAEGSLILRQELPNDQADERLISTDYACPESGMSYAPPSPQLFSFNSPIGMCHHCNGLGYRQEFVLERLIPDPSKSVRKGAIELIGPFKGMGKWRRHLYEGAANAIEQDLKLEAGALLKTKWEDLPKKARTLFLHGLGERNVTYTWKGYGKSWKHGGTFDGILAELTEAHRTAKNPMRRRQLEKYMEQGVCSHCEGERLNPQARNVRLLTGSREFVEKHGKSELSLPEVCGLSIADAAEFFGAIELSDLQQFVAQDLMREITGRLSFLLRCGLDYLTLDRSAPTLSGGESQRIRLAGQIGCGLVGVVYILDEPSIGLHPRDNDMLLESLCDLRDQGNTVVVVEHDEDTMRAADHIFDFGPGPGIRGGEIVAEGKLASITKAEKSVTGQYLSGKKVIEVPRKRRGDGELPEERIAIRGATHHNLKGVDVEIPLGRFVCVTGVSGSGKSSLVNDILWQVLNRDVNKGNGTPGAHEAMEGLDLIDKAIDIDQSPIGRTPRSNPATYVKVFDEIRDLYAKLPASKLRGYKPGRFSFNVDGGRCEHCEGHGATKLEMDFLADLWVTCPVCNGRRFHHETLAVKFKEKSIAEVLEMDIQEALEHFESIPKIQRVLQKLHDVGLDYIKLGQPSPTLSGGEAQRIKLSRELGKRSTGRTFYLLDEPTTGLHFADVHKLLDVLRQLVDDGNTVLVVEHNLDVIKCADWVIDLGPEGGEGGGSILATGTPEEIAACEDSFTGRALQSVLPGMKSKAGKSATNGAVNNSRWQMSEVLNGDARKSILVSGAREHNLQDVSVEIPRGKMSVFCGPSGSGKTSLAMDTLYAEGQRRYVESLSSYARQFLGQMPKPRVEHVAGLSPAIAIEQKTVGSTPRSTVGTVTEIYDYLRVLYARLGQAYCPDCQVPVSQHTTDEIIERISKHPRGTKLLLLAPVWPEPKESFVKFFQRLNDDGFARVRVDGETHKIEEVPRLSKQREHEIEIVVDRVSINPETRGRLADSVEQALTLGEGWIHVAIADSDRAEADWKVERFNRTNSCHECGRAFEKLTPQNFSFNSILGWCHACDGLGEEEGTSQASLVRSAEMSINDGAMLAWPKLLENPAFNALATAIAEEYDIPLDEPLHNLHPAQLRFLLFGDEEEEWIEWPGGGGAKIRYKGIYPAVYEASRISYEYRQKLMDLIGEQTCSVCHGDRIRDDAAAVRFRKMTLPHLCKRSLGESYEHLKQVKLTKHEKEIAGELMAELKHRLKFLVDVGLDYLTLDRSMPTLSGGESQRIRLAGQLGRSLTGVMYVLDEPTIGLHPRDNGRLLRALHQLRDLGNTVVLVEHDREVLESSDRLYDFGPGAGRLGGTITSSGTFKQMTKKKDSLTGQYLSNRLHIPVPINRRMSSVHDSPDQQPVPPGKRWIELIGAKHHNLRDVDLRIPVGAFTCVTGVSGSGKSSLIEETLAKAVAKALRQNSETSGPFDELRGVEAVRKLVVVDQAPLGGTPASNPATYTGVFDEIRELFTQLPEAKMRGYRPGRFSFNRPGGRCEDCEGMGQKRIEMHFLADVWVECETCKGHRYNAETLAVKYRDKTIADVLEMPISDALVLFENFPKIRRPLTVLHEIGLGYLTLGQSAPTLSGGEAQRVKLAAELAKPNSGETLYLLDEPTTGLHFDDIVKLLSVLNSLVDLGNTVVVVEHNLDVIKTADWIVDVGPEAGIGGGHIVVAGTPEDVVQYADEVDAAQNGQFRSHTGIALRDVLRDSQRGELNVLDARALNKKRAEDRSIKDVGKSEQSPWEKDGRRWHTKDRVSHRGKPCQWEGELLERVVDVLADYEELAEPNWNHRSIVEVKRDDKQGMWFLHALTGDEWLLTLKLRVKKKTFTAESLREMLALAAVDDIDEMPIYGRGERVKVKNIKGPAQEVSITLYKMDEVNWSELQTVLQTAVAGFLKMFPDEAEQAESNGSKATLVEMPWEKLGKKWHLSRKGFPTGSKPKWKLDVLKRTIEELENSCEIEDVNWRLRDEVVLRLNGDRVSRVSLRTKDPEGVILEASGMEYRLRTDEDVEGIQWSGLFD